VVAIGKLFNYPLAVFDGNVRAEAEVVAH
jgi:hypothetical protein